MDIQNDSQYYCCYLSLEFTSEYSFDQSEALWYYHAAIK